VNVAPYLLNDNTLSGCDCPQCERDLSLHERHDDVRHHVEMIDYVTGDETVVIGPNRVLWQHAGRPVWDLPQLRSENLTLFESARDIIRRTLTEPGWEPLDGAGYDNDDLWNLKLRESYACGFVDDIGREGVQRPIVLRVGLPWGDDNGVYTGDGHHRIAAAAVHDQLIPVVWSRETFATVNGDQPYGSLWVGPDDTGYDPEADRCHYVEGGEDLDIDVYALV
jgi:hypothetical protein